MKSLTLYYLPECHGCHKLMDTKWNDYQKEFMGGLVKFETIDLSQNPKPPPELTGGEMTKVPTLVFRHENFFTKIKDPFEMSTQEKTLLEGGALEREIIANIIGGYERWKAENVPQQQEQELSGGRRRRRYGSRRRRMRGGDDESGLKGGSVEQPKVEAAPAVPEPAAPAAPPAEVAKDLSGGKVPKSFDLEGGDDDFDGEFELEGGKRGRKRKTHILSRRGTKYRCHKVRRSKSKRRSRSRSGSKRRGSFGRKIAAYMRKHPSATLGQAAKKLSKRR